MLYNCVMSNMDTDRKREPIRSWVALILLSMNYLIRDGILRGFGVLFLEFEEKYQVGSFLPGLIMATFSISGAVTALPVGWMVDYLPLHTVLWMGSFLGCFSLIACTFADQLIPIIIAYGIFYGIADTILFVGTVAGTNKLFSTDNAIAVGIMFASGSLGAIFFPYLFETLLSTYGLGGTLIISGAFPFQATVSGAFSWMRFNQKEEEVRLKTKRIKINESKMMSGYQQTIGNKKEVTGNQKYQLFSIHGSGHNGVQSEIPKPGKIYKHTTRRWGYSYAKDVCSLKYVCVLIFWGGLSFGRHGFVQYIPALSEEYSYSKTLLVTITGVSELVGKLAISFLASRKCINQYMLLVISLGVSAAALYVSYFFNGLVILGICLCTFGFFAGGSSCLLVQLVVAVGPDLFGTRLGLTKICFGVGVGSAPLFVGALKDYTGTYSYISPLAGTALLLSAFAILPGYWNDLFPGCMKCCRNPSSYTVT